MNDFGPQGGDPRGRNHFRIDLSGCVNRYGPPASIFDVLQNWTTEQMHRHPYLAADLIIQTLVEQHTGTLEDEYLVGRGTSEFIARLPFVFSEKPVRVLHPFYTDFVRMLLAAEHPHEIVPVSDPEDTTRVIADTLAAGHPVLISNPCNPTGYFVDRDALLEVLHSTAETSGVLVVDESYIDFVGDRGCSLTGCDATNIVVLQSPAKFYGIAAARVGSLWTRNKSLREAFAKGTPTWPLSGIDAEVANVSMKDERFRQRSRERIERDVTAFQHLMQDTFDISPVCQSRTNFLFFRGTESVSAAKQLQARGVGVRVFERSHGFPDGACRITAPTAQELQVLRNALL